MMQTTTHSPKLYWKTCGALIALLALTWAIGYVDLGSFNLIVALAIALTKSTLVVLFFMHIKGRNRLLQLAAIVGVMWLLILVALTLSDYLTRDRFAY